MKLLQKIKNAMGIVSPSDMFKPPLDEPLYSLAKSKIYYIYQDRLNTYFTVNMNAKASATDNIYAFVNLEEE